MFVKPLIAIDIGSASVKVVELNGGDPKKLKNVGLEVLPAGVVIDDEIREQEVLIETILKLFKKMKINTRGRRVSISIGGSNLLIKKAIFAIDKETEIEEQIFEEAKHQFHHDLEDMYFRYFPIESAHTRAGESAYIIVACRIELVEQYVQLVHGLQLKVGVIDCEVLSLLNIFNYNFDDNQGLSALINVGATKTSVIISHNGEYLYSRELTFGGQDITNKIAQDLNVDFENAESLKISASLGDQSITDQIKNSTTFEIENFIANVQETISFFIHSGELPPEITGLDNIFISGGGAKTIGLAPMLSSRMKVPVQPLNPFKRIDSKASGIDLNYLLDQGVYYSLGLGLGLRTYGDHA